MQFLDLRRDLDLGMAVAFRLCCVRLVQQSPLWCVPRLLSVGLQQLAGTRQRQFRGQRRLAPAAARAHGRRRAGLARGNPRALRTAVRSRCSRGCLRRSHPARACLLRRDFRATTFFAATFFTTPFLATDFFAKGFLASFFPAMDVLVTDVLAAIFFAALLWQ